MISVWKYAHYVHEIRRDAKEEIHGNLLPCGREIEDIPKGESHRNLFAYAHEINGNLLILN